MNKKNDFAVKQVKYRNFKLSKRVFTNVLETNFKLMNETLKNNVKLIKSMMNKFFFIIVSFDRIKNNNMIQSQT